MDSSRQVTAGTLESNDIFITIAPGETGNNTVSLESSVMKQFGSAIIATITARLAEFDMRGVHITARDKGALDCTIKARVDAAIMRYRRVAS